MYLGAADFRTSNKTAEIPIGATSTCFIFEANDDEIVEDTEKFTFILDAINMNDRADENTTLSIYDNDCKIYCD